MKKMIGFCGINCSECPAFLATQNDDDIERKKVAVLWSKMYSNDIKPEEINCDGCISKSNRLFTHCNVCEIRKCGLERNLKNCAYCEDYFCEKLNNLFDEAGSGPKQTLDEIRKKLLAQ